MIALKVALAQINPLVGDLQANTDKIKDTIQREKDKLEENIQQWENLDLSIKERIEQSKFQNYIKEAITSKGFIRYIDQMITMR